MLPVTILTGFLGSGKTTLVRRLLASAWGRRIGILLNERGVAGIDDLAPGMGNSAGASGLVELTEGCVCCIDQPDLVAALELLAGRGDLERVLLETTGLADPLPITWSVSRPELSRLVTLEAVVTVIDVANWEQAPRQEWTAQVEGADVVVLGKLDLVGEEAAERARAAVRALNPSAPQLGPDEALLALVGADAIFSAPTEHAIPDRAPSAVTRPAARHSGFHTATVSGDFTYLADALEDLVTDLPASVFRAKGIARVADVAGGPVRWLAFQAVGGRAVVDLTPAPPTHGESRMAFFGRALEGSELRRLRALIDGCLLGATPT